MNDNQLFYFDRFFELYWHGIIMGGAILLGCLIFGLCAYHLNKNSVKTVRKIIITAFPLAVILARLQYWFFRQYEFDGIIDVLRLADGGFGLYGAMAGAVIAIILIWHKDKSMKLSELLDCASVAGAAAIAVGRTAAHFSGEGRGFALTLKGAEKFMLTAYSDSIGANIIAVYLYEAIAAAAIFAVLVITFILCYKKNIFYRGTVTLRFLFLYAMIQTLLESWRTDSLFLVSLGFVRFSQAFSAIIFGVLLVVFCVRYIRRYGFSWHQIIIWLVLAGLITVAFICEFNMTGNTRVRNYLLMFAGLAGTLVIGTRMLTLVQRVPENEINDSEAAADSNSQ